MSAADRVALVTGGSGGIGRGIAARLAAEGATVAVAARRAEGCQETVRQIEAVEGWVRDAAERFGRIDWLVNNAGMNGRSARLEDQSTAEFEEVVATNLLSTFYAVHAAIPIMRAQGGGAIVNIGSTASLQGYGLLSGYTASKHAVLGLTRSIALENADIPIRANCVCPGPVDTPLMRSIEVLVNPDDPAAARELFAQTTAVKRYGTVEEIADVVHFLLSDAAAYVTGTAVSVDGGVMTGV